MTARIVKANYWEDLKGSHLEIIVNGTEGDTKAVFELINRLENTELLKKELERLKRSGW